MITSLRHRLAHNPFLWVPPLTLLVFLGPIIAGVIGTLLPALGFHPFVSSPRLNVAAFCELFADPSFPGALRATLISGIGSTVLAVLFGFGAAVAFYGTSAFGVVRAALTPALAYPFASFAVGFAFLLAPSGWLARLFSPWATGWELPPDILLLRDPNGVSLLFALAFKECLFMMLMVVAALGEIDAPRLLRSARSLGYTRWRAIVLLLLPQIYPRVRLAIYAILAASMAVVDMAIVIGPTTPPPLAPLTLEWYGVLQPELQVRAAASSVFQMLLILGVIALWRCAEFGLSRPFMAWAIRGRRFGLAERVVGILGGIGMGTALIVAGMTALVLSVWSLAGRWSWPDALPSEWSTSAWTSAGTMLGLLTGNTLGIGLVTALIATVLAVLCLEAGIGRPRKEDRLWLLYLPLLLPQIGFLFGVQVLWSAARIDATFAAVVWTHLLFVLPYAFLVLGDNYRALDPRIATAARSLGAGRWRVLFAIKLPLLVRPLAITLAITFAISAGQYLPTVFAGRGHVETLATQAVALSSGADRRLGGVVAFALTALPFLGLLIAQVVPMWAARNRRGLAI